MTTEILKSVRLRHENSAKPPFYVLLPSTLRNLERSSEVHTALTYISHPLGDDKHVNPFAAYVNDKNCPLLFPKCVRFGPKCDKDDLTEMEINKQIERENRKNCEDFDDSACRQDCLLGYETDEAGCMKSCQCKKQGLLEGDIMVHENQLPAMEMMYGVSPSTRAASTVKMNRMRWDLIMKGRGRLWYIIPYEVNTELKGEAKAIKAIEEANLELKRKTCVAFVPRERNEFDYIEFIGGDSCSSSIGRKGGRQEIILNKRCWHKGIVLHEMMHAIGFFHEHSRPDRDDCVSVCSAVLALKKWKHNFEKRNAGDVNSLGSPYDMTSIMHYKGETIKNCKATILDKCTGEKMCQQRKQLSPEDVNQINRMYGCPNRRK